jgi:hypothetical protein
VIYNAGAVLVLGASGAGSERAGVALWRVVVLHAAMTVWCVVCLQRRV